MFSHFCLLFASIIKFREESKMVKNFAELDKITAADLQKSCELLIDNFHRPKRATTIKEARDKQRLARLKLWANIH